VADQAAARLHETFPGLQIESHHGYFDRTAGSAEQEAVLARIAEYRPQLLLVGMGMPLQEHWVLESLDRLEANLIFTVGGLFDYLAGVQPTPPRWMGRVGLEWLHRLVADPRRMWQRYFLEPWFVVGLLLRVQVRNRFRQAPAPWHPGDHGDVGRRQRGDNARAIDEGADGQ
jgi:N-acetylglucosaminyldiphosphoundecaprenol N-acetyl-beta-D-mannosaminyltransferase